MDYKLKIKLLCTEMDFWRRAEKASRIIKVRNKVIRDKWK
jgi:hypothetical protein